MTSPVPANVDIASDDFCCDDLEIAELHGEEAISQLYHYDLTIVTRKTGQDAEARLTADGVLGATVVLRFYDRAGEAIKTVHGIVVEVSLRPAHHQHYDQTIVMRVMPQLWQATMVRLQEVFMALDVPGIVGEKLRRLDLDNYAEWRLLQPYPTREFVVQYDETDQWFINRLTEHLGISYFFEQTEGEERLVFSDYPGGFPHAGEHRYGMDEGGGGVLELSEHARFVTRVHVVHDYNYRAPNVELMATEELEQDAIGGAVEYGCHSKTPQETKRLALMRAEQSATQRRTFKGRSHAAGFAAGNTFTLTDHPSYGDLSLLVTRVRHHMKPALSIGDEPGEPYTAAFEATLSSLPYRPPRITRRPKIAGMLTGIIEPGRNGEVGGVAQLDELGRYVVQFHFDTAPEGEQKASKPVRMAQVFAGARQGMHFPLRPGTEVMLAFAHGDPDRPIIVAAMPNGAALSPVAATNAHINRIATASGAVLEIADGI